MMNIIRILFAILLPPLGVFLTTGLGLHFWISLVLVIFGNAILPGFGHIPAVVHALWFIITQVDD